MNDLSFLAPPDEVMDWRLVILLRTANSTGVLGALPGSADDIADANGFDAHSVRVVLDALAEWGVVAAAGSQYTAGPNMPDADALRTVGQHAEFVGRWHGQLESRMTERILAERRTRSPESLGSWLAALGVRARQAAPDVLDRVLGEFPDARSLLDVAGGHGEYAIEAASRGLDVALLDVPPVVDVISDWPRVVESGVDLNGGDAFRTHLGREFDVVLCFGFTHTRPATELPRLFTNLFAMVEPGGGIAINTFLRGSGSIAALFSVQMLIAGNGGDSHRLEDYEQALTAAGFKAPKLVSDGDHHLLLARKAR